jgi:hydrogenase expression/formation protein HypC
MCLAIPGKVVSISGDDPLTRMGRIDFSGVIKQASLAYVPEVGVGDYVIVHVGFALSKVDEAEAQKVFSYLKQIGELGELEEVVQPIESTPVGRASPRAASTHDGRREPRPTIN